MGKDPSRLVLHKTTHFTSDERRGFNEVFDQIPVVEFINIAPSDFRLVQRSAYPQNAERYAELTTMRLTSLQLDTFRNGRPTLACTFRCR